MKQIKHLLFLSILCSFFYSCESEENKNSRLTLDKYTRKLNSITSNIVSSRDDEASQSRMTLNSFYDRYTSKFEDFNHDLDFELISIEYSKSREELISVSRNYYEYLNMRKKLITDMSSSISSYERANDYWERAEEIGYMRGNYLDLHSSMLDKIGEFNKSYGSYLKQKKSVNSLIKSIDSNSNIYNVKIEALKLIEKVIVPENLNDSINDWVNSSDEYMWKLQSGVIRMMGIE
jgi:hypothetical protein|tara:strand:+ start:66 stop:767 length:702 start_codon:yes stop_codon:yes gene_type:complete